MECMDRIVDVVLCRHSESIDWALPLVAGNSSQLRLVVYNNGNRLGRLPARVRESKIPNVGREAFCYITHLLTMRQVESHCGKKCLPAYTVLAQADICGFAMRGCPAADKLRRGLAPLVRGEGTLAPYGSLVPLHREGSLFYANDYGKQGPAYRCWEKQLGASLLNATALAKVVLSAGPLGKMGYVAGANYIIPRSALLSVPGAWLRHAHHSFLATRKLPWYTAAELQKSSIFRGRPNRETLVHQSMCCQTEMRHTCMPWILERFWPVVLGATGRGMNTPICDQSHPSGQHGRGACQHFEQNFRASLRSWRTVRFTAALEKDEFRSLLAAAAAAVSKQRDPLMESVAQALQPALGGPIQIIIVGCQGARSRCNIREGSMRDHHFSENSTRPSFEEGAGWDCLRLATNASELVAAVPHIYDRTAKPDVHPLRRAIRKVFEACLKDRVALLPRTAENGATSSDPDFWKGCDYCNKSRPLYVSWPGMRFPPQSSRPARATHSSTPVESPS